MKSTVKRWCMDFGYDWYGPGMCSSEKYEYKICFAPGQRAMFRTFHGPCFTPKACTTKSGKPFLIFPVYSQFVGQKEMSRSKFIRATNWVLACIGGNIREYHQAAANCEEIGIELNLYERLEGNETKSAK